MKLLALTLAIGLLHCGQLGAQCAPNATAAQVEDAKAKVLVDPNVRRTTEEENYLRVEVQKDDGSLVLSYFTLPGHPAHPASIVTAVYEAGGKVWLYSKGFAAGDCRKFEQWLKGFQQQHERIRREFKRDGT